MVLFDGDSAGLNAAIRGIDLILEQGMNVRICSFPEGEDPDSFAKSHSLEEIKVYLSEQAKDFIQFKTDLLLEKAENDPIKKASTVREIVQSISSSINTLIIGLSFLLTFSFAFIGLGLFIVFVRSFLIKKD
mgnify:CR=1 FL=1